jgi:sugar lactone lactonase YvrE
MQMRNSAKGGAYDMLTRILPLTGILMAVAPAWAASYYTVRMDDPKAVYLTADAFGARGDGVADDSDAIQKAIDKVQQTVNQGIVFVPEGRYRLTKTVTVWPSIRLIGYGAKRPVFVLADNTPGYQDRNSENYMVFFSGGRPGAGRGGPAPGATPGGRGRGGQMPAGAAAAGRGAQGSGRPSDAGAGTFYSAMSNIDIEIGDGNPGAVCVRGTYAQHSFLAHMDFHTGSGIAGVHDTGNVMEDVRFYGGQYGIWTRTPSPSWQFTAVDAYFEGQREAAIRETMAGLTLVRPQFRKVPTAITIDAGFPDELWVKDGRMEDVTGPAVVISLEENARTEINMENVVFRSVPVFASFRESGKKVAGPGDLYEVKTFSHGLHFADIGAAGVMRDVFETVPLKTMPEPVKSDLTPLPPGDTWVNVRSLGAKGDGVTDDTAVFRKAIAEHRAIYLPSGYYVISDTLALKPETALIGLHPLATQFDLLDRTEAFQGVGGPKPMIEAPKGGANVMIGIGVYTNGINPRAVGVKWMAGKDSTMNDVRLLGGHGTNNLDGTRVNPYNNAHSADPDLNRRWDSQYPSLWVTAGGGGTFFDLWTPSTFAQSGMLISDTSTEGRIYEMSSEHHVRSEVVFRNASNWRIYALQTEEERGEGGFALPLEVENCSNLTFANFHIYRVISSYQPFPYAIKVTNSKNIRFRNMHQYSNSKVAFDATLYDQTHRAEVRQLEFAWLTLSGKAPVPAPKPPSPVLAPAARVQKLAGGFFNISGGAVHPSGDFYFVDAHWQRIYRWSAADRQLSTVRDAPLDPVNLAIDKAGNIMVASYQGNGTVYSFKPGSPMEDLQLLKPADAAPRPGMTAVRPVGEWRLVKDPATGAPVARPFQYLSPDGTTFISAGRDFATGAMSWGVKSADVLRSFGMAPAAPGQPFYLTSEADVMTWRGMLGPDGNFTEFKPFVQQGGEGVAVDAEGNVYLAAGQIYVYNPSGKLIDTIEIPERPTQIVFGGKDGRTLFIAARTSLYAVRTRVRGR